MPHARIPGNLDLCTEFRTVSVCSTKSQRTPNVSSEIVSQIQHLPLGVLRYDGANFEMNCATKGNLK